MNTGLTTLHVLTLSTGLIGDIIIMDLLTHFTIHIIGGLRFIETIIGITDGRGIMDFIQVGDGPITTIITHITTRIITIIIIGDIHIIVAIQL